MHLTFRSHVLVCKDRQQERQVLRLQPTSATKIQSRLLQILLESHRFTSRKCACIRTPSNEKHSALKRPILTPEQLVDITHDTNDSRVAPLLLSHWIISNKGSVWTVWQKNMQVRKCILWENGWQAKSWERSSGDLKLLSSSEHAMGDAGFFKVNLSTESLFVARNRDSQSSTHIRNGSSFSSEQWKPTRFASRERVLIRTADSVTNKRNF